MAIFINGLLSDFVSQIDQYKPLHV